MCDIIYELPPNILCPYGGENINGIKTLGSLGEKIILNKKKQGGFQVSCQACKKKHTRSHFKGIDDRVVNIFNDAIKKYKKSSNTLSKTKVAENKVYESKDTELNDNIQDDTSHENNPPIIKKKLGRPPKPLDEKEHIINFHTEKEKLLKVVSNIANWYQHSVDSKPKAEKEKSGKEPISTSFKCMVWEKAFGDTKSARCLVCNITTIYSDNFSCGHIFPEVYGGKLEINNLMPICSRCNSMMADKHLFAFAWFKYSRILFNTSLN
jgi:5-methylcytosine-specific restriction endonuclease McrA